MNPYGHLESEQMRIVEKRNFLIDNIKCLCGHEFLHPMREIKGKYIPVNLYNKMKEIFMKYWKENRLLLYIQVKTFIILIIIIYQRET